MTGVVLCLWLVPTVLSLLSSLHRLEVAGQEQGGATNFLLSNSSLLTPLKTALQQYKHCTDCTVTHSLAPTRGKADLALQRMLV